MFHNGYINCYSLCLNWHSFHGPQNLVQNFRVVSATGGRYWVPDARQQLWDELSQTSSKNKPFGCWCHWIGLHQSKLMETVQNCIVTPLCRTGTISWMLAPGQSFSFKIHVFHDSSDQRWWKHVTCFYCFWYIILKVPPNSVPFQKKQLILSCLSFSPPPAPGSEAVEGRRRSLGTTATASKSCLVRGSGSDIREESPEATHFAKQKGWKSFHELQSSAFRCSIHKHVFGAPPCIGISTYRSERDDPLSWIMVQEMQPKRQPWNISKYLQILAPNSCIDCISFNKYKTPHHCNQASSFTCKFTDSSSHFKAVNLTANIPSRPKSQQAGVPTAPAHPGGPTFSYWIHRSWNFPARNTSRGLFPLVQGQVFALDICRVANGHLSNTGSTSAIFGTLHVSKNLGNQTRWCFFKMSWFNGILTWMILNTSKWSSPACYFENAVAFPISPNYALSCRST